MDRPEPLAAAVPALDFPQLRFDHGEAIDMLRRTVRAFAAAEIAPRAAEIDRSNAFPMDLWPKMGALGLLGINDPRWLVPKDELDEAKRNAALRAPNPTPKEE